MQSSSLLIKKRGLVKPENGSYQYADSFYSLKRFRHVLPHAPASHHVIFKMKGEKVSNEATFKQQHGEMKIKKEEKREKKRRANNSRES
jgi:hypothetical protein